MSYPYSSSSSGEEEDDYEVEQILAHRRTKGGLEYLLKWRGFPDSENTWQNESELNCPMLLHDYWRREREKHQAKPKKPVVTESVASGQAKGGVKKNSFSSLNDVVKKKSSKSGRNSSKEKSQKETRQVEPIRVPTVREEKISKTNSVQQKLPDMKPAPPNVRPSEAAPGSRWWTQPRTIPERQQSKIVQPAPKSLVREGPVVPPSQSHTAGVSFRPEFRGPSQTKAPEIQPEEVRPASGKPSLVAQLEKVVMETGPTRVVELPASPVASVPSDMGSESDIDQFSSEGEEKSEAASQHRRPLFDSRLAQEPEVAKRDRGNLTVMGVAKGKDGKLSFLVKFEGEKMYRVFSNDRMKTKFRKSLFSFYEERIEFTKLMDYDGFTLKVEG